MSFSASTPLPPESSVFPILSPNRFAHIVGIPRSYLEQLAERSRAHYRTFWDTRGKKPRLIEEPSGTLKAIQRRINDAILLSVPLPPYVIGGVKGRKHFDHVNKHVGQAVVATMDVEKCYPNITEGQILATWRRLGCSKRVAVLATKLTVFDGHLPTGAPTSPALANHVLLPASQRVEALARKNHLEFGQYADDLAFSGATLPDDFITRAIKEFGREKVKIGRKKTRVMRHGEQQIITKRLVNMRVALPLEERKKIRAAVHQLAYVEPTAPHYADRYFSVLGQVHHLKLYHKVEATKLLVKIRVLKKPKTINVQLARKSASSSK